MSTKHDLKPAIKKRTGSMREAPGAGVHPVTALQQRQSDVVPHEPTPTRKSSGPDQASVNASRR